MPSRRIAVLAVAIVALAGALFVYRRWRNDPWRTLTAAVRKNGAATVPGRLSLIEVERRPSRASTVRRGSSEGANDLADAAARVVASSTDALQKATASLLAGNANGAVKLLQPLASKPNAPASVWSDYSVALLMAGDDGDAVRYFDALAAADHALDAEPSNLAARFNRAVVLDRLYLRNAAVEAYGRYALADGTSSYGSEARQRMRELRSVRPAESRWEELLPQLERAAVAGDLAKITGAVLQNRQDARAWAESELLGQWGEAVVKHDAGHAAALLSLVRAIGTALQTISQESLVTDAVATIDATEGDRRMALATAHWIYNRGRVAYKKRDVAGATPLFDDAAEAFRRASSPMSLMADYYRASAAVDTGNRRTGLALLNGVMTAAPSRYRGLHAQTKWLRGTIFGFDGLLTDALASYERAASEFTDLGELDHAFEMRYRIASILTILGRSADARRMHAGLLPEVTQQADIRTLEATLYAIAIDALREKRWDVGQSFLTLVVNIENGNPRLHAEALAWRALAAHRAQMERAAAENLESARQAIARLADAGLREDVGNDLRLVEALMIAARERHRSIDLLGEYLTVAKARGNSLRTAEVLTERASLLRAEGREAEAEASLREAIEVIETRGRHVAADLMRDAFIGKSGGAYDMLSDLLDRRGAIEEAASIADRKRARIVLDRIHASVPARPVSRARLAPVMDERTAVIAYGVFDDRLALFVHTARGLQRFSTAVSSRQLETSAAAFAAAVEQSDREAARARGRALFDSLIAPAMPALSNVDSLVIVGDATLEGVPFAALVQPDGRYLIESFALTIAPSVQAWTARRTDVRAQPPKTVAAVGNPLLDSIRYPSLRPLIDAEAEARSVAALYPANRILIRTDATHARVTDALLHSDIAHFGVHALADAFDPGRSRLLLAPAADGTDSLTAAEVSSMDLRHLQTVVLAGCETSLTTNAHGYIRSLAAAFIAAGSRNVVASLWEIDDALTRQFSVALHHSLRAGLSPAAAVREAQLQMLRSSDPSAADARAWSSLQLYGSGE